MHETTEFLGGLKLAAAQNRQSDFLGEFEASLAAVKGQQLAFVRQQAHSRLAATVISGLVDCSTRRLHKTCLTYCNIFLD
jgi:hypothetical protein